MRRQSPFFNRQVRTRAQYAIEWCIGTVLRDGDDCLIASVIENDDKRAYITILASLFPALITRAVDPEETQASASDKRAKIANQRERQDTALAMQRIAASLLERTRLHVRVTCQAIHAKNARHMLVDMVRPRPLLLERRMDQTHRSTIWIRRWSSSAREVSPRSRGASDRQAYTPLPGP